MLPAFALFVEVVVPVSLCWQSLLCLTKIVKVGMAGTLTVLMVQTLQTTACRGVNAKLVQFIRVVRETLCLQR